MKEISLKSLGYKLESNIDGIYYGGGLDLEGTGITSLPDNLTVGGGLYLRGTGITSLPDNLTVGGSLYLRGTGITSLPDNLTVGGDLDLRGTGIIYNPSINRNAPSVYCWRNFEYIKVDGIFSKVASNHGNLYKVIQIGSKKECYLVTDGNGKWAHGNTLRDAKSDLIYKISNRDKSTYDGMSLDTELTFENAIECYRVITGACSEGTRIFVESVLIEKKEKYSIADIIRLTKGQYRSNCFEDFFKNKK